MSRMNAAICESGTVNGGSRNQKRGSYLAVTGQVAGFCEINERFLCAGERNCPADREKGRKEVGETVLVFSISRAPPRPPFFSSLFPSGFFLARPLKLTDQGKRAVYFHETRFSSGDLNLAIEWISCEKLAHIVAIRVTFCCILLWLNDDRIGELENNGSSKLTKN